MKLLFSAVGILFAGSVCNAQVDPRWKIHDMDRPVPAVISPGMPSTQETPGKPPSDAVVLFDGKDASQWVQMDGSALKWRVENGALEVVPKSGDIRTRNAFGDCQLHVEFQEPVPAVGESQDRGNSGVFLMGLYEIQVLDSFENRTYADGQASAVYGQYPPLVNAALPPGKWQAYDIVFHGPRFDKDGKLLQPARVTMLHNGVLTQDNVELTGPTRNKQRPPYQVTPEKLPLKLQEHGNPVRYRNIWIRNL
jgi:hypothetical protein